MSTKKRIHRFSKSIDIEKELCGICYGRFEIIKNERSDEAATAARAAVAGDSTKAKKKGKNAAEDNMPASVSARFDTEFDRLIGKNHTKTDAPPSTGTMTPARPANKFALFVKDNYGSVKKEKNLNCHKDVMQALASEFKTLSTK